MTETAPPLKVVVDESISTAELDRFRAFAERQGLQVSEWILVRERHRGIPDREIVRGLLDATSVLVTRDRPFHNTVLSKGLRSYHLSAEAISARQLPGIDVLADLPFAGKERPLREDYAPISTPIRALLMPTSEKRLKRLTTARRRIRNHFGGLESLDEVAVTVSWRPLGAQSLIGVRIQVSSRVGVEAILASERYVAEALPSEDRGVAALCHALTLVLQLLLHSAKVVVYHDQEKIPAALAAARSRAPGRFDAFFEKLRGCFERLTLVPVAKGRHLEALHRKLEQLTSSKTNEIQTGCLEELRKKVSEA
jgi:hypothetical protein